MFILCILLLLCFFPKDKSVENSCCKAHGEDNSTVDAEATSIKEIEQGTISEWHVESTVAGARSLISCFSGR